MRVETAEVTKLIVPHGGGEIAFVHPSFRGTLEGLAKEIDSFKLMKLSKPTSSQTASLVYDAWQKPSGKYENEVIGILRNTLFYEFTGCLCVKKREAKKDELYNGIFFEDNPQIKRGLFKRGVFDMNRQNLISRLQDARTIKTDTGDVLVSADGTVRYASFYSTNEGVLDLGDTKLAKYAYSIARYGEEGAEKIAEVAKKYNLEPVFTIPEIGNNQELISTFALEAVSVCGGSALKIIGAALGNNKNGHAFGVLNSGETNTQKEI